MGNPFTGPLGKLLADIQANPAQPGDKHSTRPATMLEAEKFLARKGQQPFAVGDTIKKTRSCCEAISTPEVGQTVIVTQVLREPLRLHDDPATAAGAAPLDIAVLLARDCGDPQCPVGVHLLECLADSRDFDIVKRAC